MTTTRRRFIALALAVPASAALAGCTPLYRNHGYVPPDDELALVTIGSTTQGELEGLVGRPSSQGLLTGAAWYYVGSRWRTYGAFEPKEIDREVVAISFDANGVVANVERFGLERGRVVTLSRRVTDSGVADVSLVGQLLGNLGNFDPTSIIGDEG